MSVATAHCSVRCAERVWRHERICTEPMGEGGPCCGFGCCNPGHGSRLSRIPCLLRCVSWGDCRLGLSRAVVHEAHSGSSRSPPGPHSGGALRGATVALLTALTVTHSLETPRGRRFRHPSASDCHSRHEWRSSPRRTVPNAGFAQ